MTRGSRRFSGGASLALLVTLVASGCRGREERPAASAPPAEVTISEAIPQRGIVRLHPAYARVGESINRQPNGASAIAVAGAGFVRGDRVFWGGEPLKTVFGGETMLTAEVPPALLAQAGEVTISVKDPADPRSSEVRATFRVLERAP